MTVTKRYIAPRFWPINIKAKKYVVSARPGPHGRNRCMPLGLVLRDMLRHAHTMKESRQILTSGVVRVNGRVRKDRGFPVGLMDVVDIGGEFHRAMPSKYGLQLTKTEETDAQLRLAKIVNKHHIGKKKVQLNFHDGTNMLIEKDDYKTNEVVAIDIKQNAIKHVVKFDRGAFAVVTDGTNTGMSGKIHAIDRKLRTVTLKSGEKEFIVPIKYVFVVGHEKPLITVGEER